MILKDLEYCPAAGLTILSSETAPEIKKAAEKLPL